MDYTHKILECGLLYPKLAAMRIHTLFLSLLAACFFLCHSGASLAQNLTIHCGRLIDGTGKPAVEQATVVVEKDRIVSIQAGYQPAAAGSTLIDWKERTVLPGLMDCHVHLDHQHGPDDLANDVRLNPADRAFMGAKYAKATLRAGFTTVRDLGGSGVNLSIRDAIKKGLIPGPRVICAGIPIGSTGGHMDESNGLNDLLGNPLRNGENIVDGVESARRAVRRQYQRGADVIKIAATGGVLSYAKDGTRPQLSQEELEAIVKTASDYGLKVAAHAHGAEGMKRAIRAGVASIEHGSMQDEEAVALFKKSGCYYVPTLTAGRVTADSAKKPGHYPPIITAKALSVGPQMMGSFRRAHAAGVKIAYGTDAGVFDHGLNYLEFQYMAEGGMAPMDIIVSATRNAADLLGILPEVGTLEVGKIADLIALKGNPLQDPAAIKQVQAVMQGGKLVALQD
jgi:imidazolonepropionase-like amidohydrolase